MVAQFYATMHAFATDIRGDMEKQKEASRTALALDAVEDGAKLRLAARAFGVTPQSVYRLRAYRAQRAARQLCPTCGRAMDSSNH